MDALDSLVHIGHEERVVEIVQTRTEERTCLMERTDSPLDQELRQNRVDSKFRRKLPDCLRFSVFLQYPLLFHYHSIQRYGFCFKFRIIYAIFVL